MTEQLKPCPFCGNTEPGFERIGTSRQSCIVACGDCGARHESSDEGEASGASWNRRAQPAQAVPVLAESELRSILQGTNHMIKNAMHGAFWPELEEACRAVEQAVRAKMGVAQWLPIETAPKDCGFLGYQPLTDDMWILAPMYWAGSEFLLLQFHHGDTEHSMTPTHWMPLPPPPGIVGKEGA